MANTKAVITEAIEHENYQVQLYIMELLGNTLWPINRKVREDNNVLYFQPYVQINTGYVVGFEALIRRSDGSGALHPPTMKCLDNWNCLNISTSLLAWVLGTVAQIPEVQWDGYTKTKIAINVAPADLLHPGFVAAARQVHVHLIKRGYGGLQIEITERNPIIDYGATIEVAMKCLGLGMEMSLDDFGTRNANIQNLYEIPITLVKLDKFFLRDIENPRKRKLVETVVDLCHIQKKKILIEGIETHRQAALFDLLNVEFAQGYLYGHAQPTPCINKIIVVADDT